LTNEGYFEIGKNIHDLNPIIFNGTKGIPDFWFQALKRHPRMREGIQSKDEEILKHLTKITSELIESENVRFIIIIY
jgi:hypothetical protein